jgi:hypothetical protein
MRIGMLDSGVLICGVREGGTVGVRADGYTGLGYL